MNTEKIPTEVRHMPRNFLEDEIVRSRRMAESFVRDLAIFVNGIAIDPNEVSFNRDGHFLDIRIENLR